MKPTFDSRRHKAAEREGYNLIAERYRDGAPSRARLTDAVIEAADLARGQDVLDLASGPGVLARAALRRVAPGRVVISDLAERALALAKAGAPELLAASADAERLPFADAAFDRVLCGLGLMFFPDERQALAEIRRVLRPRARLVVSVWSQAGAVPLVECALACVARLLPPPKVIRPSPCRLGAVLPETLASAGFEAIEVSVCQLDFSFETAADYWSAFLDMAGGAASGLSRLPAETLARFPEEVALELAPHRQGGAYVLHSQVLIARAQNGA